MSSLTDWTELSIFDGDNIDWGRVAAINDNEFIFVPPGKAQPMFAHSTDKVVQPWGIHKYNVCTNEWKKFIAYPESFEKIIKPSASILASTFAISLLTAATNSSLVALALTVVLLI